MTVSITFINMSKTTFNVSYNYSYSVGVGHLALAPTDTLQALSGRTTLEVDDNFVSNLAEGHFFIDCMCLDPTTTYRFGARILFPIQVFGVGKSPYWFYASGVGSNTDPYLPSPNWILAGSAPADPYSWTDAPGLKIDGSPKSGHTSLTLGITIQDDANAAAYAFNEVLLIQRNAGMWEARIANTNAYFEIGTESGDLLQLARVMNSGWSTLVQYSRTELDLNNTTIEQMFGDTNRVLLSGNDLLSFVPPDLIGVIDEIGSALLAAFGLVAVETE